MAEKMDRTDAAIVFGGLAIVIVAGILWATFPLYQLLDMSVVRRPFWNPPVVDIRAPGQGLSPEDLERLEQDPQQKELLKSLSEGIVYQPHPSWLGSSQVDKLGSIRSRRLPNNLLLHVFIVSIAGYFGALKYRGII